MRKLLERIYAQRRQGLYSLALSITRCPQAAEDAVHEAFARLLRSRPAGVDDPVGYVFAAVRNAAVDAARQRRHEAMPPTASIFNGPAGPVAAALAAEQRQRLRRAVEELPEPQRQAIVMKVYGELTFEQIARVLGEPLQTVASRYRRGLEALREGLGGPA